MDLKKLEPGTMINLDQEFIVLAIPDDTVEVDITAKIYINHELHEVTTHMDFPEVRAAIREAQQGYIPSDALFCLAPAPKEKMKKLLDKYTVDEDDG